MRYATPLLREANCADQRPVLIPTGAGQGDGKFSRFGYHMTISSRTPEGHPNRCPVCRRRLRLSPSWPSADAPCPHCGSLVWFPAAHTPGVIAGPATGPDFTLEDFRKQLGQVKWMGRMGDAPAGMPE